MKGFQRTFNFGSHDFNIDPYRATAPAIQPKRVGMHDYSKADAVRLNSCKGKVLQFARQGRWFTNQQLIDLTGAIDAPKRRRELEHVDGFKFEKRKIGDTNVLEFRLLGE